MGQMNDFCSTLEDCLLSDLGFKGPRFTWNNGREGRGFTQERLDRAVANLEWCNLFNNVVVEVLASWSSDHNPILISFSAGGERLTKGRNFRVEASWSKIAGYKDVVKDTWRKIQPSEYPWNSIHGNLRRFQKMLKRWVRKSVPSNEVLIQEKMRELERIQVAANPVDLHVVIRLKDELHGLLEQEDTKWRQRSKKAWLGDGDRNTKYFHACANQRRSRNMIPHVMDEGGGLCTY